MNDKFTIELDEEFLENFFELAEELPPCKEMATLDDFKRALEKIKKGGHRAASPMNTMNDLSAFGGFSSGEEGFKKNVLIVDDLGIITYQLSVLLNKNNFQTVCSQEIYDAISKYKKKHYDIVILDLFIPTEREGFLLLDEITKLNENKVNKSVIGIITASNKKEHKQICKERGVSFYIEKTDDWQKNILKTCESL